MRVRTALLLLLLLSILPGVAHAQSQPSGATKVPTGPVLGVPLPPIGLPLPSIGGPLPPIGLPPLAAPDRTPPAAAKPRPNRPGNNHRGPRPRPSTVYVLPYGWNEGWRADPTPAPVELPPAPIAPRTGTLFLELQPPDLGQVYIDGDFVGSARDLAGGIAVAPGPHRLDVKEIGYRPVTVSVRLEADRSITYREVLQPIDTAPVSSSPVVAPTARAPRKPFYVIRGCYLGDVPPEEARLPATCDPALAKTIWPG